MRGRSLFAVIYFVVQCGQESTSRLVPKLFVSFHATGARSHRINVITRTPGRAFFFGRTFDLNFPQYRRSKVKLEIAFFLHLTLLCIIKLGCKQQRYRMCLHYKTRTLHAAIGVENKIYYHGPYAHMKQKVPKVN